MFLSALPEDFHEMLATWARYREFKKTNDPRAEGERQEYAEQFQKLAWQISTNNLTVVGRPRPRHSRYGPWTPAQSW